MKYLYLLLLFLSSLACESNSNHVTETIPAMPTVSADSNEAGQRLLSELLSDYLLMKSSFPALNDTQQVHVLAKQMINRSDSLIGLSVTMPVPMGDSVGMIAQGISDELKGLIAETEARGISLSFQLTGLQLYELLRIMQFRGNRVYRFQTTAGDEANWLDITAVSSSPFSTHASGQLKAMDSLLLQ
jgi:hypothetical protein